MLYLINLSDALIKTKDRILEEATQSSIELKKAKTTLEEKLSDLKVESSHIKKQLISAKRKLDRAGKHSSSSKQKYLVEDLKSKLKHCRENTDRIETSIKHISSDQRSEKSLVTPSYEDLVAEKAKMEELLSQEMRKMEMVKKQDELKIYQLQDQLIQLSLKVSFCITALKMKYLSTPPIIDHL